MSKLLNHIDKLKLGIIDDNLKKELKQVNLLTEDKTNAKLSKNIGVSDYKTYIMYLSPADISGVNICPWSSKGCKKSCLNTAGRGRFSNVQNARLRKTLYFLKLKGDFLFQLDTQISKLKKKHKKLAIRLNGTSDLNWSTIIKRHPEVQFYDYTKSVSRVLNNRLDNYDLTFSLSESNYNDTMRLLYTGNRVAMVFDEIPKYYMGYPVVNGDKHDLRFLDKHGVIIGLTAKGDAKKDLSGFVIRDVLPQGSRVISKEYTPIPIMPQKFIINIIDVKKLSAG